MVTIYQRNILDEDHSNNICALSTAQYFFLCIHSSMNNDGYLLYIQCTETQHVMYVIVKNIGNFSLLMQLKIMKPFNLFT